MTSIEAIEGRMADRLRALWGSEGAIAKNALDANTDCETLIKKLEKIHIELAALVADPRNPDFSLACAALVADPRNPDFSLACDNPADADCLMTAYNIINGDES
jgi:hypothetical protein